MISNSKRFGKSVPFFLDSLIPKADVCEREKKTRCKYYWQLIQNGPKSRNEQLLTVFAVFFVRIYFGHALPRRQWTNS